METVFDHNPTDKELKKLGIDIERKKSLGLVFQYHQDLDEDSCFAYIAHLYMQRNDLDKAAFYLSKIKDEVYRFDSYYQDLFDGEADIENYKYLCRKLEGFLASK